MLERHDLSFWIVSKDGNLETFLWLFLIFPPLYPYFPISIRDSLLVFPKKKTRSRINHKHLLLLCYIGAGNMTTYLCFIDSVIYLSYLLPVMIVGPLLRVQTGPILTFYWISNLWTHLSNQTKNRRSGEIVKLFRFNVAYLTRFLTLLSWY